MRLTLHILSLLASCSCASSSPYPNPVRPNVGVVISKSGAGRVLCSSFDQMADATEVALVIDMYFELAGERLGYRGKEPVEVWLDPDWSDSHAITLDNCIVFNPSGGRIDFVDWILVHELVHWHAERTPVEWNLPPVINEGLAEQIAIELIPRSESYRRTQYKSLLDAVRERGDLAHLLSRLDLNKHEFARLPDGDRTYEMYALGATLVELIGVDALREAAERGPVSPEMILSMAGVSADGTGLIPTGTAGPIRMELTNPICIETRFWAADGTILECVVSEMPDSGQVPAGAIRSEVRIVECP